MAEAETWLGSTIVESESFILKAKSVVDNQEFGANHNGWLVSIQTDPGEAARWWHWQKDKVSMPGEGWVSLRLRDVELMPLSAWTNIEFFWSNVIEAIESYLDTGSGYGGFSDESAEFSIVKKDSAAIFTLRERKHVVDPISFLLSLLDGAKKFYSWGDRYIGVFPSALYERLEYLNAMLTKEKHSASFK